MKRILFIVMIAALSVSAFSQAKFGVKAGLNIAKGSGDAFEGLDSRTAGVFGVFTKVGISESIAFQPELLYSMQGGKTTQDGVDVTLKLDYINLPLMMKFYVGEGFSLNAGPQVGFLASAKVKGEQDGNSAQGDVKELYKGMDFGLNLGMGYETEIGLGFDVRYNLGLSDIPDVDDADGKNGVFQLTVGYTF